MKVRLSRDSVAAGDDMHPHDQTLRLEATSALALIARVLEAGYLPTIAGGCATWVATSREPIAVCAQQWQAPRPIAREPVALSALVETAGAARLHFSYLAQLDPEVALQVLQRTAFAVA